MVAEKTTKLETPEQNAAATKTFLDFVKKQPEGTSLSVHKISNELKLSVGIIKNLYIKNIKEAANITIDVDKKNVKVNTHPFVNDNGVIMIGSKFIAALNKGKPEAEQFAKKDKFEITSNGNQIILTKI